MEIVYQTKTTIITKRADKRDDPRNLWNNYRDVNLFINLFVNDVFIPPHLITKLEEYALSKSIYVIIEQTFDKPIIKIYSNYNDPDSNCRIIKCATLGCNNIITEDKCNILFEQLTIDALCDKCYYFNSDDKFCAVNPFGKLVNNTCADYSELTIDKKHDTLGLPL